MPKLQLSSTLTPLFVTGHWRTGTTLLHELLNADPKFACPTNYACFMPHHFRLTERLCAAAFQSCLPATRPMDDMALFSDSPQEEEFALCLLGPYSPYRWLAFPKTAPSMAELVQAECCTPHDAERWNRVYVSFLSALAPGDTKRLVLKSPVHMFRMRRLQKLFPRAQFIHIVREPVAMLASTFKLWRSLLRTQAFSQISDEDLLQRILGDCDAAYADFEQAKPLIPPGHLCEIYHEDLVAKPTAVLRQIYEQLDLGEPNLVAPRLLTYLKQMQAYRHRAYDLTEDQLRQINKAARPLAERYGYKQKTSTAICGD